MIHSLFILSLVAGSPPDLDRLISSARTYDKTHFRYVVPDEGQRRRTEALVSAVVKALRAGPVPPPLVAQARAAGFDLGAAADAAGPVWVLREPDGQRAGGGLYAFRPGGRPLCIQAPHTFFDEGTGPIAAALFARLRAGCLFMNTVHRYSPSDAAEEHPADVAHAERTLFAAANAGLLAVAPTTLVQVHGFGGREDVPAGTQAVVSDGVSRRPADAPAVRLRAALARKLGGAGVRLYGDDAHVLGATTNVEGRAARSARSQFLHVEMSAELRRALGRDVEPLAAALAEALHLTQVP